MDINTIKVNTHALFRYEQCFLRQELSQSMKLSTPCKLQTFPSKIKRTIYIFHGRYNLFNNA